MNTADVTPEEVDRLIAQLVEGSIDPAEMRHLDDLICSRPDVRQRYYRLMHVHCCLSWRFNGGSQDTAEPVIDSSLLFEIADEQKILAVETDLPDPDWIAQLTNGSGHDPKGQGESIDKDAITARQLLSLTGYVLGQALTTKLAYKAYGVAAAILVGVTLFLVFGPGNDGTATDPLAGQIPATDSQPDSPSTNPVLDAVATLTATRNAVWDRKPHEHLRAGDRFTLTQGFAEITTARGAFAIIEAPTSIELINDNAIRLHAGKLVGICETESSKGFLVRTPHMDITDLGTRFGVDADSQAIEVHVFEGEVEAIRPDAPDTQPMRLVANQSASTSADTDVIARIAHDTDRFAALLPTTIELPGTGHGLAVGDTDPNWRIVAVNGKALVPPLPLVVDNITSHTLHTPNQPGRAQWISYISSGDDWGADTSRRYVFETAINIPRAFDTANGQLELSFAADNKLVGMQVNGQPVEVPGNNLSNQTRPAFKMIVTDLLQPGKNAIRFEVYDAVVQIPDAINHAGLWVAWRLVTDPTDTTNPTNPGGIE